MDGENFTIYPTRNSHEPLLYLPLNDIRNLRVELADHSREPNKNTSSLDKFLVILVASTRDIIKLRYQ
jgi:hypothetical protein